MVEEYLFYSSMILSVMSCLALVLCIYLRLQCHKIKRIPKDLSANVFNKTFVVFNPYSEHTKLIHNFLSLLPILVLLATLGFVILALLAIELGLLLSLVILIVCLNLLILDLLPEILKNAKIFLRAYYGGTSFGVGDLQVLDLIKHALPKLAYYYMGLTAFFAATAVLMSHCWNLMLLLLSQFIGLLVQGSTPFGAVGWQVAVFLYTIVLVAIQFSILIMKKRLLRYILE